MYALQTKGKVRIAVFDNAPPFAFREPNGTYSGFEPDLGRELAKAIFGPMPNLDAVIEWVPVDRSKVLKAVADVSSPQADLALAPLDPTLATSTAVDLSDPYLVTGERILIEATNDEIRDIPDLDSKTVCVTQGTSVGDDVQTANAYAKTLALDSYASCLGPLQRTQVDAIVADEATCWQLAKQDPGTKLVGRYLTSEQHAIAVKKSASNDREGFIAFVSSWLAGTIRDGTWARLYGLDIAPLSKETKTSPVP
jgi:polar amino acid transport system substrate-binding protein